MHKFPFVIDYKVFERLEILDAKELLSEYNDFFQYNQVQYRDLFKFAKTAVGDEPSEEDAEALEQEAERNATAATDSFAALFGSRDFAESSFTGLKINWYELQQVLLEEFRGKIPPHLSRVNRVGPQLRNLCSLLLFAEYFYSKLEKLRKDDDTGNVARDDKNRAYNEEVGAAQEYIKTIIDNTLAIIASDEVRSLPEYHKSKNAIAKVKTPQAIVDWVKTNL